ncbi:MAG: metallophosphoesterase [Desulfobacteraceae bacterium]|jgi:hypothetical protein
MQYSEVIAVVLFIGFISIIYGAEIILLIQYVIAKLRRRPPRKSWKRSLLHFLSICGIGCFIYGYAIEPYWLDVTTISVETSKLKNTRIRIVHFSDTHCDHKPYNETQLVSRVNALHPDLIVFTGDTLNTRSALARFKRMMHSLNAPLGKYAVRGNFDVWYWHSLPLYDDTGFVLLDQDRIHLTKNGEYISVAGLSCAKSQQYQKLLSPLVQSNYNIFLYHYPDLIREVADFPVDLYLAGHTHGGQVALPFYGAFVTLSIYGKRYESGANQVGETLLYVNRGIGMEGGKAPRVRFWARPEITVFDIMPKK